MPHRIAKYDARRTFFKSAPATGGDDRTDELARWLATVDFPLAGAREGASSSVLVLVREQPEEVSVYAVPDSAIGEALRADLDRAHLANFELFFTADLTPEQFAGALWFLTLTGVSAIADIREEIAAEIASEGVAIDWPSVDAAWGSWTKHEIHAGGGLPGPVSRIYAANWAP